MGKVALITGITGQDGAYLADHLLSLGGEYDLVIGMKRRSSVDNEWRLDHLGVKNSPKFKLVYGDVTDLASLIGIVQKYKPSEVYNLAAQSFVAESFNTPTSTLDIDAIGPTNVFEAVLKTNNATRIYQASSSEMFGNAPCPQNGYTEESPMLPCSPYGVSKLAAHRMANVYRESYGLYIASGILFNHDSPLRGGEFVTKKVASYAVMLKTGQAKYMPIGNCSAYRDWGHAREYVKAMRLMLQRDGGDDFVIATGQTNTVKDLIRITFDEVACLPDWQKKVKVDIDLFRPCEVDYLLGDSSKAQDQLDWDPKPNLASLMKDIYDFEWNRLTKELG